MPIKSALKESMIRHLTLTSAVSVTSGTSLDEVIQVMKTKRSPCVLVCEQNRLIGIFTERDFLTKVFGVSVDTNVPIDQFMTRAPKTLHLDDTIGDAITVMHEGGYRHVPLVDDQGCVSGLLDVRDLIHFLAEHYPTEVFNLPPHIHQRMKTPDGA